MKNKELHVDTGNKQKDISGKETISEVMDMKREIERLKAQVSKLQLADEMKWDNSVVEVIFRNEGLVKKYKSSIESFLKDLLQDDEPFVVHVSNTQNQGDYIDEPNQSFCIDKHNFNQTLDLGSGDETLPQSVPVYSMAFDEVLHQVEPKIVDDKKEELEEKPQAVTCFNCLGNHHMKACPEKFDRARIAANRKDYQTNSSRYHEEEELKRAMQPGCMSDALREALGLHRNQLPFYIYHMRVLGYPPGWMKEAMFETSGLSLYDSEGNAVAESHSFSSSRGTKYDGTKFYNYPGFNTPTPDGFMDEWETLRMPPIQPHQQLSEALKSPNTINGVNAYKRKSPDQSCNGESKKAKNGRDDAKGPRPDWMPLKESTPKRNKQHGYQNNSMNMHGYQNTGNRSSSLSVSPGTPILAQGNSFKRLPDSNKFAKGITEHMPFENLPDSIGTFEKMRGVLNTLHEKQDLLRYNSS